MEAAHRGRRRATVRPPFRAGPPRDGDRKPFEKRPRTEGDRAQPAERREWKPRAEGEGGERKEFAGARACASFGSRSHEGQRRPFGMKSHDDEGRKPFKKRSEPVEGGPEERIAKGLAARRRRLAPRCRGPDRGGPGAGQWQKLDSPALNVTSPNDKIEVDGTEIPAIERTRLFLFHKPAGVVTTQPRPRGPQDRVRPRCRPTCRA